MLIAFSGRAGAGKTTAAWFFERHGFVRTRFAGPLKDMIRALGLSEQEIDGDLKEKPCALLGGATPRHAMQTLGTEWGRELIHPELWAVIWQDRARRLLDMGRSVVVDDCRFPNEVVAIKALGGKIVRIHTTDPASPGAAHCSETQNLPFDATVLNEGTDLEVFESRLRGLIDQLWG